MRAYNIAIVGATGLVGSTFLKVLEEYQIPIQQLKLFASERSVGKAIRFQETEYYVEAVTPGCFKGIDYALFSAGGSVSKVVALQATKEGAVVIDNSSAFRMDPNIPLVVPEVNLEDAFGASLIANPNCSTIQSVIPLFALKQAFTITDIEYNTYQAVSGAGYKGIHDLEGKTKGFFPYDIQATAIPQIDVFLEDGYTKEEHKMMDETKKILHDSTLRISATCVRVPVRYSHGVSIRVTCKEMIDLARVRKVLSAQVGLVLLDNPDDLVYPTSIQATGTDFVYVGRLRKDLNYDNVLLLYVVADNIRKGAASNAIQIMKGLMNHDQSR
ncbi:MAG: aspartate-semialdehyde dehydrogenase [Bacilli bacterium]|nr:aspartate-semialdehyde dehydrogenase [Bacilli bacterium]